MVINKKGIVLGLIAARKGSQGIPNKNMLKIKGKELVRLAIECGLKVEKIDLLIVSTDSERIASIARDAGADVPFIRPKQLAMNSTPMLPVMEHAILEVEKQYKTSVKCVVILDPTAPIRTANDVRGVLNFFDGNDCDLVVSVHKGHHNPYFNMLEQYDKYFNLSKGSKQNFGYRQAAPLVFGINTLVWVYSREAIMNEKIRIPEKTLVYVFPEDRSIDIDTPYDLMILEYLLDQASENQ